MMKLLRGDIIYVDLGQHPKSSVQSGVRPCLVLNSYYASTVANVCPFTGKLDKKPMPTHVKVEPSDVKGYFEKPSILLLEQITTIDKNKIISKVGFLPRESDVYKEINVALEKMLSLETSNWQGGEPK